MANTNVTKRTAVFEKRDLPGGKYRYTRKPFDIVELGNREAGKPNILLQPIITNRIKSLGRDTSAVVSALKADNVEWYDEIKIVRPGEFNGLKANQITPTDL